MSKTPMKKQALLIGINEYQILPELKYARQDAEAVEQALKQNYCFSDDEVMLLTDAKPGLFKPSNRRIIEKHLEKLAEQDLDLFIFGFWGHGLFRNGQRYFCPLDAISEDIEELGLSFDSLQRLLSNIKAKNTCMILDCCQKVHDRGEEDVLTAADQRVMENAARDIVLRRKETEPEFVSNVAILNSCKQGQAAYEWENRKHGIFTAHLLDALNRRYDSVAQIVGYISSHVEKTAMELGKTQTPFYKLEGDISLPVDTKSSPLVTGEVFVSYRHCNADLVAPVEEELKKRGISYFIDREGVNYGMEYAEALTQAIV
ncbi:MAG: caspase family protein, partial [Thermoguttaceae bacterium]|nr:caspase family protein [Thermoguttaceae bacterium]